MIMALAALFLRCIGCCCCRRRQRKDRGLLSTVKCEPAGVVAKAATAEKKVVDAKRILTHGGAATPSKEEQILQPRNLEIKMGNVVNAEETIVSHQANCVRDKAAKGAAQAMFNKYPDADVYMQRKASGRPIDRPGSVSLHLDAAGNVRVANLYGQFRAQPPGETTPGSVSEEMQQDPMWLQYHEQDTAESRKIWFQECLDNLAKALLELPSAKRSIALPWMIGCGMAGGSWDEYQAIIYAWAASLERMDVRIALYQFIPPAPQSK